MLSTKFGMEKKCNSLPKRNLWKWRKCNVELNREIFDGSLTLSPHGNLVVMLWFALKANFENSLPDLGQLKIAVCWEYINKMTLGSWNKGTLETY